MLNGNTMGDAVWTAVKATTGFTPTTPDDAKGKQVWEAICTAIVNHIVTNGEILPGSFATGPTGGPVTGEGMIE